MEIETQKRLREKLQTSSLSGYKVSEHSAGASLRSLLCQTLTKVMGFQGNQAWIYFYHALLLVYLAPTKKKNSQIGYKYSLTLLGVKIQISVPLTVWVKPMLKFLQDDLHLSYQVIDNLKPKVSFLPINLQCHDLNIGISASLPKTKSMAPKKDH